MVFVADSQNSRYDANIESLYNLHENLAEHNLKLEELPFVIQWNKRDLPSALPVPELEEELNPEKHATFEAIAVKGQGVFETLKQVSKMVLHRLN